MYVWGAGDGCWACVCPSVIMENCCAINEKFIIDGVDSITQDTRGWEIDLRLNVHIQIPLTGYIGRINKAVPLWLLKVGVPLRVCCSYPNRTPGYETYEDSQGCLDVHVAMTHNIMYLMTSCCLSLILYSS